MKNKNNKKRNKKKNGSKFNYVKYCIITIIILLLGAGIYFFLIAEDEDTSLTILERQWIMKNKETLIDINVPNNLAVLADNGEGIVFDFLSKIERETELEFNLKSYNYLDNNSDMENLSFLVLENDDQIKENDILFSEDNYVLISKTEGYIKDLETVYTKKIGVLNTQEEIIKDSISNAISYSDYKSLTELIKALEKKDISYAIVPRYYALKDIVNNDIYINYIFNNLTNKIVLRPNNNERLTNIISKYLTNFKNDNYMASYEQEFMNFYLNNTDTTDLETSSLSRKIYNYGYVADSSYNVKEGNKLYGLAGEYINLLSNMADVELNYKEYEKSEDLATAIKNEEVDIAFIDFAYENTNGNNTITAFDPQMIALSKTNYPITLKEGLANRKLYAMGNTYLESYLKENYTGILKSLTNADSKIPDDAILVLDEVDYYYYLGKGKLTDYYPVLKDNYEASYRFFVQSNEEVLFDFINFILMYADSNDLKVNSINNLIETSKVQGGFKNLYLIVALVIIIPVILLFLLVAFTKNRKNLKLLRKEDVLRYNDMLTSLKNRNYLRAHIDEWDEAKITPRTIIIADLNNLKYVNDNYGQEEGNMLIKKAAAILINTQLEKSEIIRTDGNEFLIYLIGYNKTQVNTYINKLSREFEKLPHGFGAAIGYSMITDEIKTIDDAINEASIEMRLDKEQNYK